MKAVASRKRALESPCLGARLGDDEALARELNQSRALRKVLASVLAAVVGRIARIGSKIPSGRLLARRRPA